MNNIPEKTYIDSRVVIKKSPIQGDGLFTTAPIKKGELVVSWGGGKIITEEEFQKNLPLGIYQPESAIHFDKDHKWVSLSSDPDYADAAINHSCDPNLWFDNGWPLVARRDIAIGEEITFDYSTGETYPLEGECHCRAKNCRKHITGQEWRNQKFQQEYIGHFCPYIQGLIDELNKR